jgi:hypothetical protein
MLNYRVKDNNVRGKRREAKETIDREGGVRRKRRGYS